MNDNPIVHREAMALLIGKKLGGGMSREVFACELLPDCVVKVEDSTPNFQNVVEWEAWHAAKGTDQEKWFAPCVWISYSGSILIMKRTTELPINKRPKKMPVFLTDFKAANYGIYQGRVVCHDYGTSLLMQHGLTPKMKMAGWYE